MNEFLKKGFLLGLGAAVAGKEKLDAKLKELVEKNELTKEEAKEVMNNFVEKGEMKLDEWEIKSSSKSLDKLEELGVATKADMDKVYEKLLALEEKLSSKE